VTVNGSAKLGDAGTITGSVTINNSGEAEVVSGGAITNTVTINNSGVAVVTAGGTISGPVTVNDAGKLGDAGLISGSVTVNNGEAEVTAGGTISGPVTVNNGEALVAVGGFITGSVTVNAGLLGVAGVVSGPTNIKGGTANIVTTGAIDNTVAVGNSAVLIDNGVITGLTQVAAGGLIQGNGKVGAAIINGTISPGNNSIGALTVTGSYVQNPGSNYIVDLNTAGQSDVINVKGAATLNGGNVQVNRAPGAYINGEEWTILTAGGGVHGAFSSVSNNILPGYLAFLPVYEPNEVLLVIGSYLRSVATTFNQASVANYIDGLTPARNTDLLSVLTGLRTLTPPQLNEAFSVIGGSQYQSLLTAGRLRSLYEHQLLTDQLRSNFWGGGVTGPVARGQDPDGNPMGADEPAAGTNTGMHTWAQFYGLGGQVTGDYNAAGFNYSFYGFQSGIDLTLGKSTHAGAIIGYNHSDIDFKLGQGNAGADGLLTGLYGTQTFGNVYLLAAATYGYNGFTAERPIVYDGVNRLATSNPNQNEFNALYEVGCSKTFGSWIITPHFGMHYLYLDQGSITENGANSLDLAENSQDTNALWMTTGFRFARPFCNDAWSFTPAAHVDYVDDLIGEERLISGSLSGAGGSFAQLGAPAGRNFLLTGVSLTTDNGSWFRFVADYTYQTGFSKQSSHTGSGGVQILW
jgi:outer membrane autotransporter protein